ncbi:MAG: HAD-IA family hydrolase [Treponema sp.]|nr:HAD-IA family hydrolase [Treponema sp.]
MQIEHLIFDLDNTLYPASAAMDAGITRRMMECVADFFKVSIEEAAEIRKGKIRNFSTTLEWLRSEGLSDVEGFFAHVHPENEADELEEDEKLRPFLESIKLPKIICTNAPREHAERVLAKLNISDQFDTICDIRDCNLLGKPYSSAFEKALECAGANIDNALFLDDMQKYTDGYQAMGGTAVLIGNKNGKPLTADASSAFKGIAPHPGKTFRLASVYQLPELLEKLKDEN